MSGEGVNNSNQVVGQMPTGPDSYAWGFVWTAANGMTLLGGSWEPTFVNGVNSNGQAVGQNSEIYGTGYATIWQNGVVTDLGALVNPLDPTTASSSANGVNDTGQIVGWSTVSPIAWGACYQLFNPAVCNTHAVLWTPAGVIQDLGTLPGDQFSSALKIN